jgi:hypothetical protein
MSLRDFRSDEKEGFDDEIEAVRSERLESEIKSGR